MNKTKKPGVLINKKSSKSVKSKKSKVAPLRARFRRLIIARPDVLHCYLSPHDINQYMEYVAHRYPNFVKVHLLGHSHERRPLKGIEIDWCCAKNVTALAKSKGRMYCPLNIAKVSQPRPKRHIVFIEGGTHAREWITIAVALNCIYQLTERHIRNQELLSCVRFFIVPLVNPDGYEYTRLTNRRWRKNRRPINSKCIGTDCNRNYDFHWESGPSKAHRNTFKGDKPFSEPETRAVRNALQSMAPNMLMFLSLHSYAQTIMYPWGYCKAVPSNSSDLQAIAAVGRDAIKAYNGRKYRIGSIACMSKRIISGSVVDYAFGILRVPLSLVMELPSTEYGFQPPPEAISPLGHESWHGIKGMCMRAFEMSETNKLTQLPDFCDEPPEGAKMSRKKKRLEPDMPELKLDLPLIDTENTRKLDAEIPKSLKELINVAT